MRRFKRWEIGILLAVILVLTGTWLFASGTWKLNVKPGLTVGDIVYADRKDRLTNLTLGATNQKLTVGSSAPQWQDDSKWGGVIITLTNSATTVLTSTQYRNYLIRLKGTTGASTIITPPATAGYVYFVHNSTTGSNIVFGGVTIANNKTAGVANFSGTSTYNRIVADTTP
jgi:hypothetical protein